MSNIIRFELPKDYSNYFVSRIFTRGANLYHDDAVLEIYATDEHHAYAKVRGTVDYTVSIEVDGDDLHMECNCPYGDHCKHEAAVLLHIEKNPLLEVKEKPMLDELTVLDEFRLFLSQIEYEFEIEWDDGRPYWKSYEDTISEVVDHIIHFDTSVRLQTQMLCIVMEVFSSSHDVWHYLMDLSKINLEEVKLSLLEYTLKHPRCYQEMTFLRSYVKGKEETKLYHTLYDYLTEQIPPFLRGR